MFHHAKSDGTNPPVYTRRERPLTERQHACARLLVRGFGTMEIAHHLHVEHHTIARWKRKVAFKVELGRLQALCTAAAVTHSVSHTTARATLPSSPRHSAPARMTRAQIERKDRQYGAMMDQILRAGGPSNGR